MRPCLNSIGFHDRSFADQIALARGWGVPLLELRGVAGDLDLPRIRAADAAAGRDWPGVLVGSGVGVCCVNTTWFIERPVAEDDLAAWAGLADALGAPWLRVFAGRMGVAGDVDAAARGFADLAQRLQERGARVRLALETHHGFVTAALCRELCDRAGPDLGLIWDLHHTWQAGGEDPATTWDRLGDRVVHVQIKDSVAVPSGKHPYTLVLPGAGVAPLDDLARILVAADFRGPVSLEWERLWHPGLPPIEDALAACVGRPWFPGIRRPA